MKAKSGLYLIFTLLTIIALGGCQTDSAATPTTAPVQVQASPEQTLSIGVISDDPAESINDFQPIANYLAKNLTSEGILQGKVIVVADISALYQKLESGEVDIFFESPYAAADAYINEGAIPLLRRWKGGVSEYNSFIIVRKDGGITSLDGLKGQMIAFEDAGSTSGYFLPKALFTGEGFTLTEKDESTSSVASDEIGFFFSGDSENSLALVLRNRIAAAAIQSDDYEDFPQEDRDQLMVLAETEFVPRHIAMASPLLSETLRAKIVEVLLTMDETEEGKLVLDATEKTAKFDELPEGTEITMNTLAELFGLSK